jgi:hypothetical protein
MDKISSGIHAITAMVTTPAPRELECTTREFGSSPQLIKRASKDQ